MTWIIVGASAAFFSGLLVGLTVCILRPLKCRACAWRKEFGELDPYPDPVVHRKFLERVDEALSDLAIRAHQIPSYDCPARRDATLHNEICALMGKAAPHKL